ncbi:MAG: cytochrome P450 [Sphingorhabdus sp.]
MTAITPDLFGPDAHKSWYQTYRELQETAPVYKVPDLNMFMLTRYDDIAAVIRDNVTFSNESEKHGGEPLLLHAQAREIYAERGWPKTFPLAVDPPEHRPYRSLVNHFFMGSALERTRPLIERHVNALIDRFQGDGDIEFVTAFAEHLPAAVITELLGLPSEDIPQLKEWSLAWAAPFARGLSLEQEIWVAEEGVAFQHYLKSHIDDRRKAPTDDIISQLAHARLDDGRLLTDGEIISTVDHLYIGGNETTAYALTSGMWLMLRDPSVYNLLKADKSKMRTFAEEGMRLESPTQGLYRTVTRDTEIRGVQVPKGATLHLRFAAANRDETVFKDADQINLERPNALRHMAFSQAEHHCPGAGLSRLEQNIAFSALIDRLPNLRLTPDKNRFEYIPGFVLRALGSLHLSFDPVT